MAAATTVSPAPVRISKIAGRFLVFDADAAAFLRRKESINGVLVGTAPQQPTQNIFLGLPIELRPEEAEALVRRGAAYLVDDVAAHQAVLRNPDSETRKAYIDSLKARKLTAQKVFAEKNARRAAEVAERHGVGKKQSSLSRLAHSSQANDEDDGDADATTLFDSSAPESRLSTQAPDVAVKSLAVTPTSSGNLISPEAESKYRPDSPLRGPLCQFLLSNGFFMTPGLRFGSKYSVYPGDPLRFHAHYMANQYDWHERIPIIDIVTGGRLATAVKKAFLIGGEQPALGESGDDARTRMFSIEWAAM